MITEDHLALHKAGFWHPPEVHHDFEEIFAVIQFTHFIRDVLRQDIQQQIQVICNFFGVQAYISSISYLSTIYPFNVGKRN